ncbi:MAG: DNA-binding protein WhiA [Caldisericota bacterium]|jgi:DNA-binding transcriptional regulator WhiA|nr:DNA-binding protein WhiA [Caldisericota bacterium]
MQQFGDLKQELVSTGGENPLYEFYGAIYGGGSLLLGHGGSLAIGFVSQSPLIMRYVLSLSSTVLGKNKTGTALSRTGARLGFSFELAPEHVTLLFRQMSPLQPSFLDRELRRRKFSAAFARGFFISSGYAAKDGRHLEFSCWLPLGRRLIERSLTTLGIRHANMTRRNAEVTYIKSRTDIMRLLAYWNAGSAFIALEELQLEKDIENQVNRTVNAEMGNIARGMRAIEQLRTAVAKTDQSRLSERTRQVILARLRFPDLPLSQLPKKIPGHPSKSTIQYHIRKALNDAG